MQLIAIPFLKAK